MAIETRTSRGSKVEESSNSKSTTSGKPSSRSGSATPSASGLRRSERSLKNDTTSSPPSTRKSGRLQKEMPTPTRGKKKLEGSVKKNTSSPLRCSDRSKKQSSPSSSVWKNSASNLSSMAINKEPKIENDMVQLTPETKEVSSCEGELSKGRQRFSARAYKSFFRKQHKLAAEVDSEIVQTSEAIAEQLNDISEGREHLDPGDNILAETISDDNNSLSKRKRNEANLDDAHATVSNKDASTSLSVAVTLQDQSQEKCVLDTCATSVKRQRVDNEGKEQELCSLNKHLNEDGTSIAEDSGGKEACPLTTEGASERCGDNLQDIEIVMGLKIDGGKNVCHACKCGGKLLCCDGKGCERSYHLSCVRPPFLDVPLGVWHCSVCTRKKVESGVHAVADGVESIWEMREVELPDPNGLLTKKEFFVKYKGLAHIHNQWVPETQLLSETPSLVADFNQKNKVKWRKEWATPHRLLDKRPVPEQKRGDNEVLSCHHEWLVKWCGLDYEHVTWELESASFMNTAEVQSLMRDYEAWHEKANNDHSSCENNKKVATAEGSPAKVSCLPAGVPPGLDCNHLEVVNNLRDYWHKGRNAVIIDDQERILKVISFILSLTSTVSRPFLIITSPSALDSWDEDFTRFAGCISTVVYNGNKDVRRRIRSLEFREGVCEMFQVLITSLEIAMEDLIHLRSKKWEAVIVDECQRSKIHFYSEQIKTLMTDMRVLLVNCELKDCILGENLLSLLASQSASVIDECFASNSSPKLGTVKEKLFKYVANSCKSDCKFDNSRFVEYWVPVVISCMQLEQYCATLLSNSSFLSASSKTDNGGALRDVLIATRKCCDHPNLMVDLPPPPPPAVDALDFGIKASGKLKLLDTMLVEIRNRGLRVLILFQSIGDSAKVKIGDILDDMVRQRFGENSYERVDVNVQSSRKHTALQNFNNEKQRFVFLLETRACASSIKLTSVDVVIIFGSDWSPANDIKNLQKITLDSQREQIMTFRLYSCFTLEEKILMLTREEKIRDTKLPNINRTTSHLLLKWGASYMFSKLHEFHNSDDQSFTNNSLFESSRSKDVVDDFFAILSQNGKENDASNSSILKVKQSHLNYICNSLLPGEKLLQSTNEEPTHIFWKNILGGNEPRWKYLSRPSQRTRKRVHYFGDVPKIVEAECDTVKKRKKTVSSSAEPNSPKSVKMEGNIGRKREGSSGASQPNTINGLGSVRSDCNLSKVQETNTDKCHLDAALHNSLNSLHCDLTPKIQRLCEVLQLPDDVKSVVESFLEYVMNNHSVSQESETILQAFQISLCWTAASMVKYKIDHKESLELAKEHLNFACKKEEADYRYSMLRCLKKVFLYRTESLKMASSPNSSQLLSKCISEDHASSSRSLSSDLQKQNGGVQMPTASQEFTMSSVFQQSLGLAHQDFSRSMKDTNKKFDKQMRKLLEQQAKEKEEFLRDYEEDEAQLEHKQKTDAAVIRCHSHGSMRTEKLKSLEAEYAKKFEELEQKRVVGLKNLEAMQSATRKKLEERKVKWVEGLESWAKEELIPRLPPKETGQTPGVAVSFDVHPKQVPGGQSMSDRQAPSNVCEIVSLSDDEEEITQMVESAAEVIPETALTMHVETAPVEVTPVTSASCGARVNKLEEGTLYPVSERLVADQLLEDNCTPQHQAEESDINGSEKVGVGDTNLSHTAEADLQCEPVLEVFERDNGSLVVDKAHREIEDGNITRIEKSKGSVEPHESVVPAEVSNVCSEVADVNTTVALVESIDKLRLCDVDSSTGTTVEQQDCASPGVPDTAATNATNAVDLPSVISGGSTLLDSYQNDVSTVQDNAASAPEHRDGRAELSEENLPPLRTLTETCSAGDSAKNASSAEVNQQDPTGVSNMGVEVADGSSTLIGKEAAEIHNTTDVRTEQQPCDRVDSLCTAAEGEVDRLDGAVTGSHDAAAVTEVVVGEGDSLREINDVASAEILDNQTDGIIVHDVAAPITTSQDDNSQETLLTRSASVHDGVIPVVLDTDNRELVNAGDSCRENNGSSAGGGLESVSSKEGTADGQHDGIVIPPVPGTASEERMDLRNTCGEKGHVSTELNNGNVGILVQDVSASTSSRDDGSEEIPLTNTTSIPPIPETISTESTDGGDSGQVSTQHENVGILEIPPIPETISTESTDGGDSGQVSTQHENVGILVQDVAASTSNRDDGSEEILLTNSISIPPIPETISTERMDGGNSCRENDNVSTQHVNETVGILVQDVAASTSNRDDGSEEILLTNSTSIQQPEAAASTQVSQLLSNQPVQDEAVVQPTASTRANVSETAAAAPPSTSAIGARLLQATPVYRVPLPLGHDPLQNELDRIRRESDRIVNVHEKEKLQLKSDCEKEIEEVVAQIRNKYEAKIKEKETEFVLSKLELDANHSKIMMNKILAEAFRSKCMDIRACNSPGVLQDAAATFMQQFQQMTSQHTQPDSVRRSAAAAASSSLPLPQPGAPAGGNRQTTGISPSPATTTTSRAQTLVHHSASRPLSSPLLRPPNISSISSPATTTTTKHLQVDSQNRAPAPHLQGLRPTAASMRAPTPAPNVSHSMQLPIQRPSSAVLPSSTAPLPHQPEAGRPAQQNDVVCLSDDDD